MDQAMLGAYIGGSIRATDNLWRKHRWYHRWIEPRKRITPQEQALCLALGMLIEQDARIKKAQEVLGTSERKGR